MWDLPRPGLEPVSPALAGRFSTTAPPGKPRPQILMPVLFLPIFLFYFVLFYLFNFIFCWGQTHRQQGALVLSVQHSELLCMYTPRNQLPDQDEEWAPPPGVPSCSHPGSSQPQGKLYLEFYHHRIVLLILKLHINGKSMDSVPGFFCWLLHLGESTKMLRAAVVSSFSLMCSILSCE